MVTDSMAARASRVVGVDVGGTFTDVVLWEPGSGGLTVRKVLSTPDSYDVGVIQGMRDAGPASKTDPGATVIMHGTTVGTNAILQRTGARTALVTTAGFRDVLEIRRNRVPVQYDLGWRKPPALIDRALRFEIGERIGASGDVIRPLDEGEVRQLGRTLADLGVESVAVCLLHSYLYPDHERRAGAILREQLGDGVSVSLSCEIQREVGEYERTAAVAVNAYLQPIMHGYLEKIVTDSASFLGDPELYLMHSAGGLLTKDDGSRRPVFAVESGPAAGVTAARALASSLGFDKVIFFEMGGTTAKAALVEDGKLPIVREYEVGGGMSVGGRLRRGEGELLRVPALDIAEVGTGGGSIGWVDAGGALRVGPRSAGARPGPACYGLGGSDPTTTDANVVLGFIRPGPLGDGALEISAGRAEAALGRLGGALHMSAPEAAAGVRAVANAGMLRALRSVSTDRGRDPRDYVMVAAGGAGPLHAAALADELGIDTVIVPALAGTFSAVGLLFARRELHATRFCDLAMHAASAGDLQSLEAEMKADLSAVFGDRVPVEWDVTADVRAEGQSWDLEIAIPQGTSAAGVIAQIGTAFRGEYLVRYGISVSGDTPLRIRALRVRISSEGASVAASGLQPAPGAGPGPSADRPVAWDGTGTPVWSRCLAWPAIGTGPVPGPVLVEDRDTTAVVPAGWSVAAEPGTSSLILKRQSPERPVPTQEEGLNAARPDTMARSGGFSGADLQILVSALATVADEMATTIHRTAHSSLVRDVMDFAAAVCDPDGSVIAQALTVPLMLGAVPHAMSRLRAQYGADIHDGDVFVMNDPFGGGMHTSDIFLAKPVFRGPRLLGWGVTVAHHSDVGGRVPGTTAADNTDVFQEGLRLPWVRLISGGTVIDEVMRIIESNVRLPEMTQADLYAQLAACAIAERSLRDLASRYGAGRLDALCTRILSYAEQMVTSAIEALPDGSAEHVDYLDSDGISRTPIEIRAAVTIRGGRIVVDLSGSGPLAAGALNCTRSVTDAVVYHAVLSALEADVPQVEGAFWPIEVVTAPGTVAEVTPPAASSQRGVTAYRIYDTVLGALAQLIPGLPATGEGGPSVMTMTGQRDDGSQFVYHDNVVGAWGGSPGHDGNDGLSNPCAPVSNISVEVAEQEFPLRIEEYALVPDSGGPGQHRGGCAVQRSWRALSASSRVQVRADRQDHAPRGLDGGEPGSRSATWIRTPDGQAREMAPMFSSPLRAGDLVIHRCAGGGGWGDPRCREPQAIARDLAEGKLSAAAGRAAYGTDPRPGPAAADRNGGDR